MNSFTLITILVLGGVQAMAQNVGIGTSAPQHKLHVYGSGDVVSKVETSGSTHQAAVFLKTGTNGTDHLQLQKWVSGTTGTAAGIPLSNLSVVATGFGSGPLMIGTLTAAPFHMVTNSIERLRITPLGNISIGDTTAAFKLDVNGRIRIHNNGTTAGIWFNNTTNSYMPGFVGLLNDQNMGLYGSGASWSFLMNVNTGNVSIGATAPNTSKLKLEGGSGDALEISGGIKVSGNSAPAFRMTANENNLSDLDKQGHYTSIIIDHPYTNNRSNAIIFITPVSFTGKVPIGVEFDIDLNKWKIITQSEASLMGYRYFGFVDCNRTNRREPNMALADHFSFRIGDSFNVLIINR